MTVGPNILILLDWKGEEGKGKRIKKELKCITYVYQLPQGINIMY